MDKYQNIFDQINEIQNKFDYKTELKINMEKELEDMKDKINTRMDELLIKINLIFESICKFDNNNMHLVKDTDLYEFVSEPHLLNDEKYEHNADITRKCMILKDKEYIENTFKSNNINLNELMELNKKLKINIQDIKIIDENITQDHSTQETDSLGKYNDTSKNVITQSPQIATIRRRKTGSKLDQKSKQYKSIFSVRNNDFKSDTESQPNAKSTSFDINSVKFENENKDKNHKLIKNMIVPTIKGNLKPQHFVNANVKILNQISLNENTSNVTQETHKILNADSSKINIEEIEKEKVLSNSNTECEEKSDKLNHETLHVTEDSGKKIINDIRTFIKHFEDILSHNQNANEYDFEGMENFTKDGVSNIVKKNFNGNSGDVIEQNKDNEGEHESCSNIGLHNDNFDENDINRTSDFEMENNLDDVESSISNTVESAHLVDYALSEDEPITRRLYEYKHTLCNETENNIIGRAKTTNECGGDIVPYTKNCTHKMKNENEKGLNETEDIVTEFETLVLEINNLFGKMRTLLIPSLSKM